MVAVIDGFIDYLITYNQSDYVKFDTSNNNNHNKEGNIKSVNIYNGHDNNNIYRYY